jgi:ribosomal protein L32
MGKPKKQTSPRKTGLRRSHLVVQLARMVNAKSPVKAYTTRRESGKKKVADAKPAAKKTAAKK